MSTLDYINKLVNVWLKTRKLHKHYEISVSNKEISVIGCSKGHVRSRLGLRLNTIGVYSWRWDNEGQIYQEYIYLVDPEFFEKLEKTLLDRCEIGRPRPRRPR